MASSRQCRSALSLVRWIAALGLFLLQAAPEVHASTVDSPGSPQRPELVQLRSYVSASGVWELSVNPSAPTGLGPATYTMSQGGQVKWKIRKEFTLTQVAVSNSGRILGVGEPPHRFGRSKEPDLIVAILDANGKTVREKRHPRSKNTSHYSTCFGYMDRPGYPDLIGVHVQNELQRGIVRVWDRGGADTREYWWVYDLEFGKRKPPFTVQRRFGSLRPLGAISQLLELPGTPLLLVHWHAHLDKPFAENPEVGTRFAVLDERFRAGWTVERTREGTFLGEPDPHASKGAYRLAIETWLGNEIHVGSDGEFEIHDRLAKQLVKFQAAKNRSGRFTVHEVESRPFTGSPVPVRSGRAPPERPKIQLEKKREFDLGLAPGPRPALRDIVEFAVRDENLIEFIRREEDPLQFTLVRITPEGEVLSETGIHLPRARGLLRWVPLPGGDWAETDDGDVGVVRRIRGASGRVEEFWKYACEGFHAITPLPDGGVIVLPDSRSKELLCVNPAGSVSWQLSSGVKDSSHLVAPSDVTVTANREVAVLETNTRLLRLYSLSGEFERVVRWNAIAGEGAVAPDRVHSIPRSAGGGVCLSSTKNENRLWRLDREFNLVDSVRLQGAPLLADHDLARRAQVATDGTIWTTDGQRFATFEPDGTLRGTVGDLEAAYPFYETSICWLGSEHRWLMWDLRTDICHVVDAEGRRRPIANRELKGILPEPRYTFGVRGIELRSTNGELRRVIERRPDDRFWNAENLASDEAGRLAVLDQGVLFVYDAEGALTHQVELPVATRRFEIRIAGHWVLMHGGTHNLILVDLRSETVWPFALSDLNIRKKAGERQDLAGAALSKAGDELWIVIESPPKLVHFALP